MQAFIKFQSILFGCNLTPYVTLRRPIMTEDRLKVLLAPWEGAASDLSYSLFKLVLLCIY